MSLALVISLVLFVFPQDEKQYLHWLVEKLESLDPDVRASSYTALTADPAGALIAVSDFSSASSIARELRASLIFEKGTDVCVESVLALIEDPNPKVNEFFLRFLAKKDLSRSSASRRAQFLYDFAKKNDSQLVKLALESLGKIESAESAAFLCKLVRELQAREFANAALSFLMQREDSLDCLLELSKKKPELHSSQLPSLWFSLAQRAQESVLTQLWLHFEDPDALLATAARAAFDQLVARFIQRQEFEKAEAAYQEAQDRFVHLPELSLARARFHLFSRNELAKARDSVKQFEKRLDSRSDRDGIFDQARLHFYLACLDGLEAKKESAEEQLRRGQILLGKLRRHLDEMEESQNGYELAVWQAKGHLLSALFAVPSEERMQKELELFYSFSVQAQDFRDAALADRLPEGKRAPFPIDDLLDGELGLYSVLEGPVLRQRGVEKTEEIWLAIGNELSKKYPREFSSLPPEPTVFFEINPENLYRIPSSFPFHVADFYSSIFGNTARALEILHRVAKHWRIQLNVQPGFASQVARTEFRIGSLYMDRKEGDLASAALRRGLSLLEDYQRNLASDAEDPYWLKAQMASAYVSLAVNENVVRGRPESAREYLEKAFALDPSPFNRVLLACYQARAGKREEALEALYRVDPEPALFYNMACSYALLGEKEAALKWLRAHFASFLNSEGDLKRSLQWAAEDPDLESLQKDPEFRKLIRQKP